MIESRFLNPKNDVAFRKIFGTEAHKNLLISFLNEILEKKDTHLIKEVTFLNPMQKPEFFSDKQSIVDVLCTDETGVQYIVEMQVASHDGFEKRAQYYAAKAYCSQMQKKGLYKDLKEVIFLGLLNFTMFPDKSNYKSMHVTLDKESKEHDLKAFSFTFVELPKFNKAFEELKTEEDRWLYYFKHSEDAQGFKKLLTVDSPVIQEACYLIDRFNWSEEEINAYEAVQKREWDNKARESHVFTEGKVEGRIEGKIEIAKNLIGKNKFTLEDIAEITGLRLAEVKALIQ